MKAKILDWIRRWESKGYSDGIPDEACPYLELAGKAPSYRRVCIAIMRNDYSLETLGLSRDPCEVYNIIKRMELMASGKIKPSPQMDLFQ